MKKPIYVDEEFYKQLLILKKKSKNLKNKDLIEITKFVVPVPKNEFETIIKILKKYWEVG